MTCCGEELWRPFGEYFELTTLWFRDRAEDKSDELILTAQVASAQTCIYDITEGEEDASTANVGDPIDHVIATIWGDVVLLPNGDNPTGGYNVEFKVPGAYFTGVVGQKKKYRVQTWVIVNSGDNFWLTMAEVTIKDTLPMPIPEDV